MKIAIYSWSMRMAAMHQPSSPVDLPLPDRIWIHAVTRALLDSSWADVRLTDNSLSYRGAGGWWRMWRFPENRAVFCGQDPDFSHGHLAVPEVDVLAGGPEWLPWKELRRYAAGSYLGFVYWWHNGSWSRAPYPDDMQDDGLAAMSPWPSPEEDEHAFQEMWGEFPGMADLIRDFQGRVAARTVEENALRNLLGPLEAEGIVDDLSLPEALDFANRAGLSAISRPSARNQPRSFVTGLRRSGGPFRGRWPRGG